MLSQDHETISTVRSYNHQETTRFETPTHISTVPSTIRKRPREWTSSAGAVCEVTNAQLVGPDGLTVLTDGTILLENSLGWSLRVILGAGRALKEFTTPTYRGGKHDRRLNEAVSLVGSWSDNYYHWFVDYMARLQTVEQFSGETGRDPTLIVPAEFSGWHAEALSLFGYDDDDWVEFSGGRLHVNQLIVPTLPRDVEETAPNLNNLTYTTAPSALRWLQKTGLAVATATEHAPDWECPDRIYISRKDMPMRRVVNRDELLRVLSEYGITAVQPEKRSIIEQIRLFEQAQVVVGPHGAGLTNILFGTDLTVISLFGEDHHPVYYAMSEQLDHKFACLVCDTVGEDLRVDPDRLRSLLDKLEF